MRKLLLFLFFSFVFLSSFAQGQPSGYPLTKSRLWIEYGYVQADSALIVAIRDTNWVARFPGSMVYWRNSGVDSSLWIFNGDYWSRSQINPNSPLFNAIKLYNFNVSSTTPTDGQALVWSNLLNAWTPTTLPEYAMGRNMKVQNDTLMTRDSLLTNTLSIADTASVEQYSVNVRTLLNFAATLGWGGGASVVTSFNSRTGAVTPATNDYNIGQINSGTLAADFSINNNSTRYFQLWNGTNTYYRLFADGTHWWGNGSTVTSNGNRYQFYGGNMYLQNNLTIGTASSLAPITMLMPTGGNGMWLESGNTNSLYLYFRNSGGGLGFFGGANGGGFNFLTGAGGQNAKITNTAQLILGTGTSTNYSIDANASTTGIRFPRGTTAQQPTNTDGVMRYNTDILNFEFANGTTWRTLFHSGSTIGVGNGGTGFTSTTAYGVLLGGTTGTGAFQNAGTGTTGQVLTSNGSSAVPTWQDPTGGITKVGGGIEKTGDSAYLSALYQSYLNDSIVTQIIGIGDSVTCYYRHGFLIKCDTIKQTIGLEAPLYAPTDGSIGLQTVPPSKGGTGVTSTTAYGLIVGGTTSTGNFQNAGTGTTGQVLVSAGASALPTWQAPTALATIYPWYDAQVDSVATSDATATTLRTITIPDNSRGIIEVRMDCINNNDGLSGLTGIKRVRFKKISGTLTLGVVEDEMAIERDGGLSVTATFDITTSSNNIIIQVTGVAATNLKWRATYLQTTNVVAL